MAKKKPCLIEDHSACEPLMDIAHKFRNYAMRVEALERENEKLQKNVEALRGLAVNIDRRKPIDTELRKRVDALERENGELRARFELLRQFDKHTLEKLKEAHR